MSVHTTLYDTDFHAWCETQAALLDDRQWQALDREHRVEELHLMAGTERRALGSQLERLLLHLLTWQYQPRRRLLGHSWEDSIVDARARLRDLLEEQPSLEGFVVPRLARSYAHARRTAARQTRLPLTTFPETCPWTPAQVQDDTFWPDAPGG
jgi:hypothetical protein